MVVEEQNRERLKQSRSESSAPLSRRKTNTFSCVLLQFSMPYQSIVKVKILDLIIGTFSVQKVHFHLGFTR